MYKPKHRHRTNRLILPAILAALAAGGCAQTDEPLPGNDNSVMFGAYISNAVGARASVANLNNLKKTGFGVFASNTGTDDFQPDATAGSTPAFMYNRKVEWKNDGTWTYTPKLTWPSSGKLSFFAYAPHTASGGATGITGMTAQETSGSPRLHFTMDSDVDRQTDLLCADTTGTVNLVNAGIVRFNFRHALARVGYKAAMDQTLAENTTVSIKEITLRSAAFTVSGKLNLASGQWEDVERAEMAYTHTTDDFYKDSYRFTKNDGTDEAELTADGKLLMIMPTDNEVPVELTVKYDVRTVDPNLAAGAVTISNTLSKTLGFKFETGKAYSFTLRIGLKAVEIDTDIADWDDYVTGWTPVEPV